jgi:dethiobiotin synthetase
MSLPGLFVVGTDTGVGKTRIAAAIVRCLIRSGRSVGVLKPVATGGVRTADGVRFEDADILSAATGQTLSIESVAPIRLQAPLAPPLAARLEGVPLALGTVLSAVDIALSCWSARAEVMVVEGIGGFLCPLAEGATVADLAVHIDYPLVIVAQRRLGTLNHTLLTMEAAAIRDLRVAAVVLNGTRPPRDPVVEQTNRLELARRLDRVPVLDVLYRDDPETLSDAVENVDWYSYTHRPRAWAGEPLAEGNSES